MSFVARVTLPFDDRQKPARAYFHEAGFDAFGRLDGTPSGVQLGTAYVSDILEFHKRLLEPAGFVLAFLWGSEGRKVVELFGYSADDWPGNPDVHSWVFKDGIYHIAENQISCGDSMIVLGREEEHRRRAPDLKAYMQYPPDVSDLMRS